MHELAIAQQLIDTAVSLLPPDSQRVSTLRIELGDLAGVSEDELRFGLQVMSANTRCEGATVEITRIPAIIHCPQCGADSALEDPDVRLCPKCGVPASIVLQGKELLISSMEVSDEAAHG